MALVRVEVKVFGPLSKKPILTLHLDETTIGQLAQVAEFVAKAAGKMPW